MMQQCDTSFSRLIINKVHRSSVRSQNLWIYSQNWLVSVPTSVIIAARIPLKMIQTNVYSLPSTPVTIMSSAEYSAYAAYAVRVVKISRCRRSLVNKVKFFRIIFNIIFTHWRPNDLTTSFPQPFGYDATIDLYATGMQNWMAIRTLWEICSSRFIRIFSYFETDAIWSDYSSKSTSTQSVYASQFDDMGIYTGFLWLDIAERSTFVFFHLAWFLCHSLTCSFSSLLYIHNLLK
jgi:hypothetical protein